MLQKRITDLPSSSESDIPAESAAAIIKALQLADVRARLDATGFEVKGNSPQEFAAQVHKAFEIYKRIAADAGIAPE